jgi:hypothetical protein
MFLLKTAHSNPIDPVMCTQQSPAIAPTRLLNHHQKDGFNNKNIAYLKFISSTMIQKNQNNRSKNSTKRRLVPCHLKGQCTRLFYLIIYTMSILTPKQQR